MEKWYIELQLIVQYCMEREKLMEDAEVSSLTKVDHRSQEFIVKKGFLDAAIEMNFERFMCDPEIPVDAKVTCSNIIKGFEGMNDIHVENFDEIIKSQKAFA